MAHAIEFHDRLAVGYTDLYGKAWHEHENATHYPENVPIERAEAIFDFDVEKYPVYIQKEGSFEQVPSQFLLVDAQHKTVLSPSTVTDKYTVVQNRDWFELLRSGILTTHELKIESCGTLFNRKKAYLNAVVMEHKVKGDVSPTLTRLLYTNSFDNCSYMACVNQVRVVCNNTLRAASAQGAANGTLRKFRHTAGSEKALGEYAVEMAEVVNAIKVHNDILDVLAVQQMSTEDVETFLQDLFVFKEDAEEKGREWTGRKNRADQVLTLFDSKPDLTSGQIKHTKYAMLNAVTEWADHDAPTRNGSDMMSRQWSGLFGQKDVLKQAALSLLVA